MGDNPLWQRLMSFDDVRFVRLTRDDMQSWISANMRRQIITLGYLRRYNREVDNSIVAFLLVATPSTPRTSPSESMACGASRRP